MDITFHTPETRDDGSQTIEDAEWGRWVIHVNPDGTCTIKVYDDETYWVYDPADRDMTPTVFPTLDAAKAEVQRLYADELRAVGL